MDDESDLHELLRSDHYIQFDRPEVVIDAILGELPVAPLESSAGSPVIRNSR